MPLVDVTVESTDYDLTTTSALKSLLGISGTSADTVLSDVVRQASRWAERVVGYPLALASYREVLPAYGTRSLMLARTPVVAVDLLLNTTTTDSGTQVLTSEFQLNARAGLLQRAQGWQWTAPSEQYLDLRPLPGQEFPDWVVDYVAGYTYGGLSTASANWSTEKGTTSTGRTLPEDIERAVLIKAARLYDGADEVVKEQVGDLSVTYGASFETGSRQSAAEMLLLRYARTV